MSSLIKLVLRSALQRQQKRQAEIQVKPEAFLISTHTSEPHSCEGHPEVPLCRPMWAACPPPRLPSGLGAARCPLWGRLRGASAPQNRPPAPRGTGRDGGRGAASPHRGAGQGPHTLPPFPQRRPRPTCLSPAPAATAARPLAGPTVNASSSAFKLQRRALPLADEAARSSAPTLPRLPRPLRPLVLWWLAPAVAAGGRSALRRRAAALPRGVGLQRGRNARCLLNSKARGGKLALELCVLLKETASCTYFALAVRWALPRLPGSWSPSPTPQIEMKVA